MLEKVIARYYGGTVQLSCDLLRLCVLELG